MKRNNRSGVLFLAILMTLLVIRQRALGETEQPTTPAPHEQYSLITFVSDREGNADIYIMNADGSELVNLSKHPRYDTSPRWVSNQTITFSAVRDEHERQVFPYIMSIDGSDVELFENMETLLDNGFSDVSEIFPSPDGNQIAFVSEKNGNNEIYIMDGENSEPINISNNLADDDSPDWSPDSTQIAFESDRSGNYEVYILDMLSDGAPINLTRHDEDDFTPAWSPDGKKVAFGTNRDGNAEIYTMNVDGSGVTNLTNNLTGDWNPDWSPDGSSIVFHTDRDENREIYIMSADGTKLKNLTNHPSEDAFPTWSPWLEE